MILYHSLQMYIILFSIMYYIILYYIILYYIILLYYNLSFYIILYCIFYHMKNNYVEDMSKSMHDLSSLNSFSQALNLEVWQGFAKVLPNNQALEEYLSTWAVKTMPVAFRESTWWSANHHFFGGSKWLTPQKSWIRNEKTLTCDRISHARGVWHAHFCRFFLARC